MNQSQDGDSKPIKKQFRVRKKERTKEVILAAAEELYSDKPMNEVFLEDIAEAAFISRSTIYNYFKNKDDVFFTVGNKTFKSLNETIEATLPAESSGKEQVLFICEKTFNDSIDNPIILKITREFFDRLNDKNLTTEEINDDIIEKLGLSTLNNLIENSSFSQEFDFEEFFEEPVFIEFFIQLLRSGNLWLKAIGKGKKDKTIKNDLEDMQIVQYMSMLMNGLLYEMQLRRTDSNEMGIKRDTIIDNSLNHISNFLEKNV